jgi:endonuclease YncB( thermonuclease family)
MKLRILVFSGLAAFASPALADPCTAVSDRGPTPAYLEPGSSFAGPVTYVGDGDSMCVGVGASPREWVEVRLADFYAPELSEPGGPAAKAALKRITSGRHASCVAEGRSYDRIVAHCSLNGIPIGDQMRAAGVSEGGRGR